MNNKHLWLLLLILIPINLNASSISTENNEPITSDVCGFVTYNLNFDDNQEKEIVISNANTSRIVDAFKTTDLEYPLVFPTNISDLNINIITNNDNQQKVETIPLHVEDCGYNKTKDDYPQTNQDTFVLAGNTIDLKLENQANIKNVRMGALSKRLSILKLQNDRYTYKLDPKQNIYHVEITYNDRSKRFYEIEVYKDANLITSRIIDSLKPKEFAIHVNYRFLIITIILCLLYLLFNWLYKKAVKKEREYLVFTKRRRPTHK